MSSSLATCVQTWTCQISILTEPELRKQSFVFLLKVLTLGYTVPAVIELIYVCTILLTIEFNLEGGLKIYESEIQIVRTVHVQDYVSYFKQLCLALTWQCVLYKG